jgi:hypothetical protein
MNYKRIKSLGVLNQTFKFRKQFAASENVNRGRSF